MAVSIISEPYVKVTENIRETPNQLNIDGSTNIGGVIVAPAGPRLSYVSGPKDFLEKYTVDGDIPRNADISLINAYYMSFSAGMVIARSMNTTAVNGLLFKNNTTYESKIPMELKSSSVWGIAINGILYWHDSNTNVNTFVNSISSITDDNGKSTYVDNNVVYSVNQYISKGKTIYCSDLVDLATQLAITADSSTTELLNGINLAYSSSVGGLILSKTSSFMPSTVFTVDLTVDEDSDDSNDVESYVAVNINYTIPAKVSQPSSGLDSLSVEFKDGVMLNKSVNMVVTISNLSTWAFTFGTLAYYKGAIDKSIYADYSLKNVDSIDDVVTSINGIKGMAAKLLSTQVTTSTEVDTILITYSDGNRLYTSTDSSLRINCTVDKVNGAETDNLDGFDYVFGIYANQPQDSDCYKIMVSPDEDNLFKVSLTDLDSTDTYTVSLYHDAVDQSGSNAYIENLNALGLDFTVIVNSSATGFTPASTQSFAFGNSGLDLSSSASKVSKIDALYALEDQELFDIEYLAPFGETNLQFIKNYVSVGKNNDWFTPVDIPYDRTNSNSIKGYYLNVDNSSNIIGMGPFDKNTGLTGWLVYIAASTLYYTKVMANKASRSEFAPCFDITNGILDYTNPVYMLGKEDRVKLLNFKCPVDFLEYDQKASVYYFNDNRTHQSVINIVSEEQNRRLVNKIKKDCRSQMKKFKGRFNTESTRSDVRELLNLYFTSTIMSQIYKPDSYEIVCDTSNNDNDIIAANKLAVTVRVKLYNAIKFIDVLVDVYPLNVDFTE